MYVVIRKFSAMGSVPEAARRAESGIGQILKQSPGFVAYYVFDGGNGVGGSVTLFEDRGKANAAKAPASCLYAAGRTSACRDGLQSLRCIWAT